MAKKRKLNGVGFRKASSFVKLDHGLLSSDAWAALTPDASKVLLDLWRRHNGLNNGTISYSRREAHACLCAAHGCNVSTRRANKALDEIQAKGFAIVEQEAAFTYKTKTAREWRVTAEQSATGDQATRDFARWKIQNTGTVVVPDGDRGGP